MRDFSKYINHDLHETEDDFKKNLSWEEGGGGRGRREASVRKSIMKYKKEVR